MTSHQPITEPKTLYATFNESGPVIMQDFLNNRGRYTDATGTPYLCRDFASGVDVTIIIGNNNRITFTVP